ncbi:type II secretion system GspH family protein [Photobacterium japonica]|uniref:type II secretion system protein n=1 Tax=Photobacterium japonica TaxID=2910235 RepID=UPI003D09E42F
MKRQGGFTLIEMVVVIVILGILAVTAAPRFLNLQDDARASSLQGLKGAIDGAAAITYGRAAIEGQETVSSATTTQGAIPIAFGYPQATSAALNKVVNGLDDWKHDTSITGNKIAYTYKGNASAGQCIVTYTQAVDENTPAKTEITFGAGCNAATN